MDNLQQLADKLQKDVEGTLKLLDGAMKSLPPEVMQQTSNAFKDVKNIKEGIAKGDTDALTLIMKRYASTNNK